MSVGWVGSVLEHRRPCESVPWYRGNKPVSVKSSRLPTPRQGGGSIAVCAADPAPTRRAAAIPRPYGAVPHDLAADPRLSATAVRVATVLLFWARAKDHCWPADASSGAKIGRCIGTVQRALRQLEAAGWIARERTDANRTGRIIRLAWRSAGARPPASHALDPPVSPALDEEEAEKRDATKRPDAALLDRLKKVGLPEDLARRFAQGEQATSAARVLANVQVLRSQGRLTNPAGYIRAAIEQGYALLPAAAKRIEAERLAEETSRRNAAAALARAQAEADRKAAERAEADTLARLEPAKLDRLVQRAVAELPPALTRKDQTIRNAFVRAKVVELERARSPGR
jgi:hypothetical protein